MRFWGGWRLDWAFSSKVRDRPRLRRFGFGRFALGPRLALARALAGLAGTCGRACHRGAVGDSHRHLFQRSILSTVPGQDFFAKLLGEQETHGAPPGYFAALSHFNLLAGQPRFAPGHRARYCAPA